MVIEEVSVGPWKVKSVVYCLPDARVAEFFLAGVKSEKLGCRRAVMFDCLFFDFAFFDEFVVVSGCPRFGNVFIAHINIAGEQSLQGNGRILIIVVFYFVEVEKAFAGGDVFCPVVWVADKRDVTPGVKVLYLIRAIA